MVATVKTIVCILISNSMPPIYRHLAIVRLLMALIACCSKILRSWTSLDAASVSACSAMQIFCRTCCSFLLLALSCKPLTIFTRLKQLPFFSKYKDLTMVTLGKQRPLSASLTGLKTLTQHFYGGENINFFNQNY